MKWTLPEGNIPLFISSRGTDRHVEFSLDISSPITY